MPLDLDKLLKQAMEYHSASSYPNFFEPSTSGYEVTRKKNIDKNIKRLSLATINLEDSLINCINNRRSDRTFGSLPLSICDISELLWCAGGIVSKDKELESRTYPSAGALFQNDIFIIINKNEIIKHGWYFFSPYDFSLIRIKSIDCNEIQSLFKVKSINFDKISIIIFVFANIEEVCSKYGERGYRYMLIEAGHMIQNVCLVASKKTLPCVPIGGFDDATVNTVIESTGAVGKTIYSCIIGKKNV